MEHSMAILEDANQAVAAAAETASEQEIPSKPRPSENAAETEANNLNETAENENSASPSSRKRKGNCHDGQKGGRDRHGGPRDNKRHKKGDMGRGEYFASQTDRRKRNADATAKREREGPVAGQGIQFSKEEIDAEERRPKRKVAVLIGYSGTGYKGMQISGTERTIEGDLFQAFIKAGAISKANAEDPKKSSLIRCARTDKGVHAAGNMISLKLIVEDDDIVEKINAQLCSQIRVWGIERTIGSFSCYQSCDSRWYEYLIPSHAFLPPHPSSWLAKQLEKSADEQGDKEGYENRQKEVIDFWDAVEATEIKPILDTIDEDIRFAVIKALQGEEEAGAKATKADANGLSATNGANELAESDHTAYAAPNEKNDPAETPSTAQSQVDDEAERTSRLRAATKQLRNAYIEAKRRYRIQPSRVARIQAAISKYVGTKNYHNYTIQKTFKDASANRHIKSFVVNKTPILIGDGPDSTKSEWLSLKVHGQSFMMHQIRKMVGMIALMVRSGSDLSTMDRSFTEAKFSIPKVPGLGLLLERPVFDSYNSLQAAKHEREPLRFDKYEKELEAFKQREIYQRIFREEEERNEFGRFFNHIDNFREPGFLYVTSAGLAATKGFERKGPMKELDESDDEAASD